MTKPTYWQNAVAHLSAAEPLFAQLAEQYGGEAGLKSRGDAYGTLVRSIIGQQISVKAADTIEARVRNLVGDFTPQQLRTPSVEDLRSCGLSQQKVRYLQALTEAEENGHLADHHWQAEEEAIRAHLIKLPGIGPWTADMFMIFHLLKPDVWPMGDVGLQNALNRYFDASDKQAWQKVGEPLKPYRTVATWYLWRSLDPTPVAY